MPVTTQAANQLIIPGVYVYVQNVLQAVNPYVNTALNGFVGGGNWGPVDTPVVTSGPASIFAAFGNDTIGGSGGFSLVEEMLTSCPEDGSGVGVRVTDGTDAAATIVLDDAQMSPTAVLTLTALYTGSLPNGNAALGVQPAGARVDLVSGTSSVSPVYQVSIFFPNALPEVFNNIVGYATIGDPYAHATFIANALAAINGTAPNTVGSQRWVATGGSSTHEPALATVVAATGGADGTTSLAISDEIGAGGSAPTGMYALSGTNFFHLVLANMNDLSNVAAMSDFVAEEGAALGFATVAKGQSDAEAFTARLTNAAIDNNMVLIKDYIQVYDSVQQTFRIVSPLGKAAGIIGLCPPYVSPINEPWNITGNSAGGVIATEQTLTGLPRSAAQLTALITNGFVSITNQMPINNGAFGMFDDVTAAGSPQTNSDTGNYIPVVRMSAFLAQAFVQLGGIYVGRNQSTQANDPTRAAIEATYNNFLAQLAPASGPQWIDTPWQVTCDLTNNTPTTIAEGYCFVTVLVRYLGVIRIFYVTLQGGTNVQVSNTPPPGFPG